MKLCRCADRCRFLARQNYNHFLKPLGDGSILAFRQVAHGTGLRQ
jgi:hypothetical protein